MGTFQADHLLFNVHYGRSNKIKNDKEDAAWKLAQEETVKSGTDLFDLEERVRRGASAYVLLVAEFQPCGDLHNHTIVKGPNQGKKVKKQKWSKINHLILFLIQLFSFHPFTVSYLAEHEHSDYEFEWHCKFKNKETETEKDESVLTDLGKRHRQLSARAKVMGVPG